MPIRRYRSVGLLVGVLVALLSLAGLMRPESARALARSNSASASLVLHRPDVASNDTQPGVTRTGSPAYSKRCQYEPGTVTFTGVVALPPGYQQALLQTSWYITHPASKRTQPVYQFQTVQQGSPVSLSVDWPGIQPTDTAVHVHIGTILLDPRTRNPIPDTARGFSEYWYPWVCEVRADHAGMTWRVREQRSDGVVHVGDDEQGDPYHGDTPPSALLPILCLKITNSPVPSGITPDFYNGWARGSVAASTPVRGWALTSWAVADRYCANEFGPGWRMAEFHDGYHGPSLEYRGGWSYWAYGTLPTDTRFWVAINDQIANPWN